MTSTTLHPSPTATQGGGALSWLSLSTEDRKETTSKLEASSKSTVSKTNPTVAPSSSKSKSRSRVSKAALAGAPPRPPNAWILYRSEQIEILKKDPEVSKRPQSQISKLIGVLWSEESESVRASFARQAEVCKQEHRERYPDYRFRPTRKETPARTPPQKSEAPLPPVDEHTATECTPSDSDPCPTASSQYTLDFVSQMWQNSHATFAYPSPHPYSQPCSVYGGSEGDDALEVLTYDANCQLDEKPWIQDVASWTAYHNPCGFYSAPRYSPSVSAPPTTAAFCLDTFVQIQNHLPVYTSEPLTASASSNSSYVGSPWQDDDSTVEYPSLWTNSDYYAEEYPSPTDLPSV